jgi:DNA-3-methyladenine glycosylase I
MTEQDIKRLMQDTGIVRNQLKINSIIKNARAYLRMEEQGIDFSVFIWSFVDATQVVNHWAGKDQVPTSTIQSDAMAKALKAQGFHFQAQQFVMLLYKLSVCLTTIKLPVYGYESSTLVAK